MVLFRLTKRKNMAKGMKCYNCGKGIMIGHEVSKAKNRTRKIFKPNLHRQRIIVDGRAMRVRLCTKCGRLLKFKSQNSKVKSESQNLEISSLKKSEVSSTTPAVTGLA